MGSGTLSDPWTQAGLGFLIAACVLLAGMLLYRLLSGVPKGSRR